MTADEISGYLSAALDQEACKDTLRAALVSRVESLAQRGIEDSIIVRQLEELCEDPYQINDDVIREVIAWKTNSDGAYM